MLSWKTFIHNMPINVEFVLFSILKVVGRKWIFVISSHETNLQITMFIFLSFEIILHQPFMYIDLFLTSGRRSIPRSTLALQVSGSLKFVTMITAKHYQVVVLHARLTAYQPILWWNKTFTRC